MTLDDLNPTSTQKPLVEIAKALSIHSKMIIESGRELAPIIHGVNNNNRHFIMMIGALFSLETERVRGLILSKILRQESAIAYVIATESWTLRDNNPDAQLYIYHRLSEDRRISTLSLMGESLSGDKLLLLWEIEEGEVRHIDLSKPIDITLVGPGSSDNISGRMTDLFGDRKL